MAVLIDGCFWHSCPIHGTEPASNRDYWLPKLARIRERDLDTTQVLTEHGWLVLRYWEHEPPEQVASAIFAAVQTRRRA